MLSKTTLPKLARIPRALWSQARSFSQLRMLADMALWNVLIRSLKPFLSVKHLITLAAPYNKHMNVGLQDVLRNADWFNYFKLSGNDGDCLIKALILHRYLSMAGANSNLLIGFRGNVGHAWVEISGKAIRESTDTQIKYTPTMVVKTGSRNLIPVTQN